MLNYPEYLKLICSSGLLQADLELASHPLASGSELVVHARLCLAARLGSLSLSFPLLSPLILFFFLFFSFSLIYFYIYVSLSPCVDLYACEYCSPKKREERFG